MPAIKLLLGAKLALLLLGASLSAFAALTEEQARAIVNDPNRTVDAELDMRRHPVQLLIFTGVEPGMRVGDFDAGGAWTTELLGRAVGPQGVIYTRANPDRLAQLQERLNIPGLEHAVPVGRDRTSAFPPEAQNLDLVIGLFAWHHLIMGSEADRAGAYANIYAALKPGGYLIVSDTQAVDGAPASTGGTLHRMDPGLMRSELEGAGFIFVEASDLLHNPADPLTIPAREVSGVASGFLHKYMKPE